MQLQRTLPLFRSLASLPTRSYTHAAPTNIFAQPPSKVLNELYGSINLSCIMEESSWYSLESEKYDYIRQPQVECMNKKGKVVKKKKAKKSGKQIPSLRYR